MKYAVVDTNKAVASGLKEEYHILSHDRTRMIVNENELATLGEPEKQARRLGGELIGRKELNVTLKSEIWNR